MTTTNWASIIVGDEFTARVWDSTTGAALAVLRGHAAGSRAWR